MVHAQIKDKDLTEGERGYGSTYSTHYVTDPIPKYRLPEKSMPANVAHQLCLDELNLDGNPHLNLASFVTTWMEPEAENLISKTLNKNLVDQDEYPQTKEIEKRCVSMIAHLFHASEKEEAIGTSTIGSSEAVMLAGLSHKWSWRRRQQTAGRPFDRPNIVMSADVQVVWDKFARYFEVEPRILPMETDCFTLDPDEVANAVDEQTICVVGVVGTTFTGEFDPIEQLNDALVAIRKKQGWDIPLHVDAASGGFIAPFLYPRFKWDFRLPQVKSINVSGHKYGFVYPGIGWVVWRDRQHLPDELIFHVNYLGGDLPTFNLNFSRGGSHVIAQYYNFLRFGHAGYQQIATNLMNVKNYLAQKLTDTGLFEVLTSKQRSLPLVTAKLSGDPPFTVFDLSAKLRERGWIVPAYTLPPNAESIAVLRFVVREGISRDMAEILVSDIQRGVESFTQGMPPDRLTTRERRGRVC